MKTIWIHTATYTGGFSIKDATSSYFELKAYFRNSDANLFAEPTDRVQCENTSRIEFQYNYARTKGANSRAITRLAMIKESTVYLIRKRDREEHSRDFWHASLTVVRALIVSEVTRVRRDNSTAPRHVRTSCREAV